MKNVTPLLHSTLFVYTKTNHLAITFFSITSNNKCQPKSTLQQQQQQKGQSIWSALQHYVLVSNNVIYGYSM